MKLWSGRFDKPTDKIIEEFTASLDFDKRLYKDDIAGSIAHAKMLAKVGIISTKESDALQSGLSEIYREIDSGQFSFDIGDEDIHMAIERALIDKIGSVGGKLHTARSRNDQITLDLRLYLKKEIVIIATLIKDFQAILSEKCRISKSAMMPGYTHLQRAQPILFSHHLLAYFFMLERDFNRLKNCFLETDVMPLGSAALAGTSFPIDRDFVSSELGFSKISDNSLDSVSDRDFVVSFLSSASLLITHLSRLAEEIVLWSSQEFGFVVLDDAHATGSSIMPQKKNPDFAELIRGKTGRIFGNLMAMLTVLKGLPLAYNRDLQEDKEGLFDTIDTIKPAIVVIGSAIQAMTINIENMEKAAGTDFSTATDYADYLVKKGIPFRAAHEVVGEIVKDCIAKNKDLSELSIDDLKNFSNDFDADALELHSIKNSVDSRTSPGGTAPISVEEQLAKSEKILKSEEEWLSTNEYTS